MKGDGEGESGGTRKSNFEKLNNDIKMTRREFIKASAAFGAAVAGIPYNLTDLSDIFLKRDGELVIYPIIHEYKHDFAGEYKQSKLPFKRLICFRAWGCNWNCRWCPTKFSILKDMMPITMSIDQITELLLNFGNDTETMAAITGGEPLIQKGEVLKSIKSLKTNTNYRVMLLTNGSLIDEEFLENANELGLDGIDISFYCLDDEWHKWYTGYSNKDTIKALKLLTERFKGLVVVTIVLFSNIDIATLKNMCKFLFRINSDFVIKLRCPSIPRHEKGECERHKRQKAEEILLHFVRRMDRNFYFSKQINSIEYLIKGRENGHMDLVKIHEWTTIKKERSYERIKTIEKGGDEVWLKTS